MGMSSLFLTAFILLILPLQLRCMSAVHYLIAVSVYPIVIYIFLGFLHVCFSIVFYVDGL